MLKKIITTAVLSASALGVMTANAAMPGVYFTGQIGYANTHMKGKTTSGPDERLGPVGISLANSGLAGRLALGYQFNKNFAIEAGYFQIKTKRAYQARAFNETPGTKKLQQNSIDLVAKGILPVSDKFNVYGKLGAAYLTSDFSFWRDSNSMNTPDDNPTYGIARHKWAPEAAVGVSYDITPNVSVDTSWTHIQPVGKNRPGNIDFVAVGIGYNFG